MHFIPNITPRMRAGRLLPFPPGWVKVSEFYFVDLGESLQHMEQLRCICCQCSGHLFERDRIQPNRGDIPSQVPYRSLLQTEGDTLKEPLKERHRMREKKRGTHSVRGRVFPSGAGDGLLKQ